MRDGEREGKASIPRRDVTIVRAASELDFISAPDLENALTAGSDRGPSYIVVDFTDTRFMDSSGINALLRANRSVSAAGGWIRLCGVSEPVLSTIQIVGLQEVISMYTTAERACEDVRTS